MQGAEVCELRTTCKMFDACVRCRQWLADATWVAELPYMKAEDLQRLQTSLPPGRALSTHVLVVRSLLSLLGKRPVRCWGKCPTVRAAHVIQ
jgi:hypothetical protein